MREMLSSKEHSRQREVCVEGCVAIDRNDTELEFPCSGN
jgi:hypothetical protein